METTEKFSTKINKKVLSDVRALARRSKKKISLIVSEALAEYLQRAEVRPAFRDAAQEIMKDHRELLKELAK